MSAGCARDSHSVVMRSASAAPPPPAEPPPPAPATPAPKPDVVDTDACKQARSELKQLEHQAAVGCDSDDQCLLDADCLIRTSTADTGPIQEARMAMESVCARAPVERLSCAESPARCDAGRCVASRASR